VNDLIEVIELRLAEACVAAVVAAAAALILLATSPKPFLSLELYMLQPLLKLSLLLCSVKEIMNNDLHIIILLCM